MLVLMILQDPSQLPPGTVLPHGTSGGNFLKAPLHQSQLPWVQVGCFWVFYPEFLKDLLLETSSDLDRYTT